MRCMGIMLSPEPVIDVGAPSSCLKGRRWLRQASRPLLLFFGQREAADSPGPEPPLASPGARGDGGEGGLTLMKHGAQERWLTIGLDMAQDNRHANVREAGCMDIRFSRSDDTYLGLPRQRQFADVREIGVNAWQEATFPIFPHRCSMGESYGIRRFDPAVLVHILGFRRSLYHRLDQL
jgi:hypothetical protein